MARFERRFVERMQGSSRCAAVWDASLNVMVYTSDWDVLHDTHVNPRWFKDVLPADGFLASRENDGLMVDRAWLLSRLLFVRLEVQLTMACAGRLPPLLPIGYDLAALLTIIPYGVYNVRRFLFYTRRGIE